MPFLFTNKFFFYLIILTFITLFEVASTLVFVFSIVFVFLALQ